MLVEGGEGLQLKAQDVASSSVLVTPKTEPSSCSLDVAPSSSAATESDPDDSRKQKPRSPYKIARVSPPRTRGSLKVRFKDTTEEKPRVKRKKAAPKSIENGMSPQRDSPVMDDGDDDDKESEECDLAETYSIYVKNILRLQPLNKQLALIKCINTTIGNFIND